MTKIYFNESSLNRLINVGLDNSINNLRSAIETSSMLYIPYYFNYRSYLKSLDDNLKSDLNTIIDIYNKIKNSSINFSNINDNLNSKVNGIENYSISLRQSAIK